MAKTTILFGTLLIVLGVGAYGLAMMGVLAGRSPTALIPAAAGLLLLVLGFIADKKPSLNKHMMHGAVLIGLLGFIGAVSGVFKLVRYATDSLPADAPIRVAAWVTQSIMAGLMAAFVALCIKSFIDARRARQATAAG